MTKDETWLLQEKYQGVESEAFHADCARLKDGEPLGYVIGWVPFLDCKVWLDSKPLIPRAETEFWTEQAIKHITTRVRCLPPYSQADTSATGNGHIPVPEALPPDESRGKASGTVRVLDLCAGSGAIGIAVAKALPEVHVTFAELDARHLPTIGKNLTENGIDCTRYQVWQSDLFANVSGTYDHILSNPPYIDPALDRTEPAVKKFEPHHALYGGQAGMEFISHIIAAAPQFLNRQGELWLEHEPEQSAAIAQHAAEHSFIATTHTDQYHIERYSVLMLK